MHIICNIDVKKIIGTDLGTPNFTYLSNGEGEIRSHIDSEGAGTTPSVVAFSKNGERLVGQAAKQRLQIQKIQFFRLSDSLVVNLQVKDELKLTYSVVEGKWNAYIEAKLKAKKSSCSRTNSSNDFTKIKIRCGIISG